MKDRARQGADSSNYKNVQKVIHKDGTVRWEAKLPRTAKIFDTEREAALCIDKNLISRDKEPVNILKRKQ